MPAKKPSKIVIPRPLLLRSKPIRNPYLKWEKYPSGEVVIYLKYRKTWLTKLASLFIRVPEYKKLALDKVGSLVWELCDGKHTVSEIIDVLVSTYKLKRREAEVALVAYLQQLIKRKLIGLLPPKGQLPGSPSQTK